MVHDESKDVRLLSKVCKINPVSKVITINRNQIIGNKRWGRLDFLCNYKGYRVVYSDGVIAATGKSDEDKPNKKAAKREKELNRRKKDKIARR